MIYLIYLREIQLDMLHTKLGEISFAIGLVGPCPGFHPLPPLSELDGTVIPALTISFVCQQQVILSEY